MSTGEGAAGGSGGSGSGSGGGSGGGFINQTPLEIVSTQVEGSQIYRTIQNTPLGKTVKNFVEAEPTVQGLSTGLAIAAPIIALFAITPIWTSILTALINVLARGASVLSFLYLPFITRKRHQKWGVVRDAKTGLPLTGVFVELGDFNGRIIDRVMTDKSGAYGFLVEKLGSYFVEVRNPLYQRFVSPYFTVENPLKTVVSQDIALESIEVEMKNRLVRITYWIKTLKVFHVIALSLLTIGSFTSVLVLLHAVTPLRILTLGIYVILWLSLLLKFLYEKPYGQVVDGQTKTPQSLAVVQLIDKNSLTLVHSTVTDNSGRFLFVTRPGNYMLVVAKEKYQLAEHPITGDEVNITIPLQPSSASATVNEKGQAQ